MDFAKKQLKKYGWKEGQGLGMDETGIVKPIRVGIKRDHAGVGAAPGEEFSNDWWSKLFNEAASNISVANSEDDVKLKSTNSAQGSASSLKEKHYGRHRSSLLYGGFLDSTRSYDQGDECCKEEESGIVEKKRRKTTDRRTSEDVTEMEKVEVQRTSIISEDDLIKACEGRTGHKAARHGLRLSGKLKRIKDQEQRNISSDKVSESSSPMSELGVVTQRRTQSRTIHTRQLEMIRRTGTDTCKR